MAFSPQPQLVLASSSDLVFFRGFVACLLVLLSTACRTLEPAKNAGDASPEASAPAASPEPTNAPRALQLWIPSELWAGPKQSDAQETQADSSTSSTASQNAWIQDAPHPFEISMKPGYGAGDIASFLASTHSVSPERLPDLAIVPLSSVPSLRELGVIQNIASDQPWLDPIDSSPSFAREIAHIDDQVWTVPLAIDLALAIGRDREVPSTIELTESFRDNARAASPEGSESEASESEDGDAQARPTDRIVMPIGGSKSTDLVPLLALYAGFGGELDSLPAIDSESPSTLLWLEYLALGLSSGHIVSSSQGHGLDSAWNTFIVDEEPLALVRAGRLIDQTEAFPGLTWASVPGPDEALPSLAWGWGLVLIHRSEAAIPQQVLDLAEWFTGPQCTMQWIEAGHFPADNSTWGLSFAGLDSKPDKDFLAFVREEFESSLALPDAREWGSAWAQAGKLLLEGADTPSVLAVLETP